MTAHHQHPDTNQGPGCRPDRDHPGQRLTTDGEICEHGHCVLCTRNHTPAGILWCGDCTATVRRDLEDIRFDARHLRWHASRGEGLSVPSARIPGGDAMVALARAGASYDDLTTRFATPKHGQREDQLAEDHQADDVVPVLLPLLGWEHQWRTHFGHTPRTGPARAPITAITRYLTDHLTEIARAADGPDVQAFADDMQALRRQLEGILHDEQDPQTGVPCFDCGRRLVRRWGDPKRCKHDTPGRRHVAQVKAAARLAQIHVDAMTAAAARANEWLAVRRTYPELGRPTEAEVAAAEGPTYTDLRAARRTPTAAEVTAAQAPCTACVQAGQGGIADPSVGQSWECLGCRKEFTAADYVQAVRSYLLTSGPDRDGWTHIAMAAEAASTMTAVAIPANTVRRWMDRGMVFSVCRWAAGEVGGQRLVYWPSVAEQAAAAVERAQVAERERAVVDLQRSRLAAAVTAGESPEDAGRRLGIHPARVARFVGEWDAAARLESA